MSVVEVLTFDNLAFKAYAVCSAVLVIKMMLMGPLTAIQRFSKKAFANPEDLLSKKEKVKFDDPDVERVRRAHRNDLENILPFLAVGFLYVLTKPNPALAIYLFLGVAVARIAHTLVYAVYVVPQPARAICYFVAVAITVYMAVCVMIFFILS